MNSFSVAKKIGLVVSLGLSSTLSMADSSYDIEQSGMYSSAYVGAQGTFTDAFHFTVPEGYLSDFSMKAYVIGTEIEFTDISFQDVVGHVWADTEYEYEPHGDGKMLINAYSSAEIDLSALSSGSYSVLISGINNSSSGSNYDWSASLDSIVANVSTVISSPSIASPVPEPSSVALMVGGLGLVGFMAARRRKASSENS